MSLESLPAPGRTALLFGASNVLMTQQLPKLDSLRVGLCLVGAVHFVFRNA